MPSHAAIPGRAARARDCRDARSAMSRSVSTRRIPATIDRWSSARRRGRCTSGTRSRPGSGRPGPDTCSRAIRRSGERPGRRTGLGQSGSRPRSRRVRWAMLGPVAGDHVEPLRGDALEALEQVRVDAHLQDRAALDRAGELRVADVVAPIAERRARAVRTLEQEVGMAAPATVEEGRLEDDVGAIAHRVERAAPVRHGAGRASGGRPSRSRPRRDRSPEVRPGTQPHAGRPSPGSGAIVGSSLRIGFSQRPSHASELEGGEMVTGEVADEVRGADDQRSVGAICTIQP